jgi:hypothetical protein
VLIALVASHESPARTISCTPGSWPSLSPHTHTHTHTHMHMHTHTHTHTHTTHTRARARTHARTRACARTHLSTCTWQSSPSGLRYAKGTKAALHTKPHL